MIFKDRIQVLVLASLVLVLVLVLVGLVLVLACPVLVNITGSYEINRLKLRLNLYQQQRDDSLKLITF